MGGFLDPTQARVSQTGAVGYLGKLFGQGALLEAIGRAIGEDAQDEAERVAARTVAQFLEALGI